jgi:hypothetical protein
MIQTPLDSPIRMGSLVVNHLDFENKEDGAFCARVECRAFIEKQQALAFEKYLESGSDFAFRNKHLI